MLKVVSILQNDRLEEKLRSKNSFLAAEERFAEYNGRKAVETKSNLIGTIKNKRLQEISTYKAFQ